MKGVQWLCDMSMQQHNGVSERILEIQLAYCVARIAITGTARELSQPQMPTPPRDELGGVDWYRALAVTYSCMA